MNEAQILANAMTKDLSENADVLLVFVCIAIHSKLLQIQVGCTQSGLFSAVVTAFVAMTSQNLQMEYAPITAELMFKMVQLQRAALDGSDSASVQPSSWTPASSFLPSKVVGEYPFVEDIRFHATYTKQEKLITAMGIYAVQNKAKLNTIETHVIRNHNPILAAANQFQPSKVELKFVKNAMDIFKTGRRPSNMAVDRRASMY